MPTITNVGEITVHVKAENANYETAEDSYTLKVTQKAVSFTGESDTRTYTESEIELTTITPDGLLEGHSETGLSYSAKGTDVGEYDGEFSGTVTIVDAGGNNVTANYDVTTVPGKLVITKAGTLTVSGVDYEGIYDAEAHGEAATPNVTTGTTVY